MWSTPQTISLKQPSLQITVHDSGDVRSDTQAAKPVLFFVHGLGMDSMLWKYVVEHLAYDYRCISIDLPGHGGSREQRGNFSMAFYAQVVRACIEEMKLTDITLIGHSMGGQISIIASLQMPAVVTRLVLVTPAGIETFTTDEAQKIIQGADFIYRAPFDVNQILASYTPHFSAHAERIRELVDDQIFQQTENFAAYNEMLLSSIKGMLNEPVFNFLPHIHQPTLVLFGEKDQVIPNKWVHPLTSHLQIEQTAKHKILKSETKLIPLCGHYLPFEQPKILADEIHRFCLEHS